MDGVELRTRSDLQRFALRICQSVSPYFSPGCAQLRLGQTGAFHDETVAGMEGFARVLWGLAPLAAGGADSPLWDYYRQGVVNGTDPAHPEYWGDLPHRDQLEVEMAALGVALLLAPDRFWDPLTGVQKTRLVRWLDKINHRPMRGNNWVLFRVLVNLGLKKVGAHYSRRCLENGLCAIERFYLGNGWYSDGACEQRDYYTAFAIHFYCLIYAAFQSEEDPVRSELYKSRAASFAPDFAYWFSEDGSSLPFGRSLTYRFAQCSFWGALAFAGVEALPWGVMKGIVLRNLRWWSRQPIFSNDGLLTIGYAYPNLLMSEGYNSPGSPYWALKAFLPLGLEEMHPFWTSEECPLDLPDEVRVQPEPHMVISRLERGRHVVALTAGQTATFNPAHNAAKYEKFAYSNVFGFSVPKANFGLIQCAADSMLAVSEGDEYFRVRQRCEEYRIEGSVVYSRWKPWADVGIETWLVPMGHWHVRVHRIATSRFLDTAEGGFAVRLEPQPSPSLLERILKKLRQKAGGTRIRAASSRGFSGIVCLNGKRSAVPVEPEPNTHLLHPRTLIPTLRGELRPGTHVLAAAVLGTLSPETGRRAWKTPPCLTIGEATVTIRHGTRSATLQIGDSGRS